LGSVKLTPHVVFCKLLRSIRTRWNAWFLRTRVLVQRSRHQRTEQGRKPFSPSPLSTGGIAVQARCYERDGFPYHRIIWSGVMKRKLLVLALSVCAAAVLAAPSSAVFPPESPGAWTWSWGHNYLSANYYIHSGFNYWWDEYLHKHTVNVQLLLGWSSQEPPTQSSLCYATLGNGSYEYYQTRNDLGCGGYREVFVYNDVTYSSSSAYLFVGAS